MNDLTEQAGNLIIQDGKVLLLYTNDEDWWEAPGGPVKENESATTAAIRNTKNEIGVEVELEKPFYTGEYQHKDEMFLWNGYIASIHEEPELQEENFQKMEWFKGTDLDELNLSPALKMILPALRKI